MYGEWHLLPILLIQLLGNVLEKMLPDMLELEVVNMSSDGTLLSFYGLVYHALVLCIHCESQFLHQELGEVLPEQECGLQSKVPYSAFCN
jgi:hypothetical protein